MAWQDYILPGPPCQTCGGTRLARVYGHCSDMCTVDLAGRNRHGYVPDDMGVGGGDAVQIVYCLDCGQLRGRFPIPPTGIERGEDGRS
jgi:hypothetical protein